MAGNISKDLPNTECLCPKCGTKHMMKLLWIGRGTPRKFCANCRKIRNEIADVHHERNFQWR